MSPSVRRWEIDALRGLMLVLMTVTHLPTRFSDPLGQPLGYVSAAEGFVLLSGAMAGLVYGRLAWRHSITAMRRAFWRRALVVYGCHAAMLVFLFAGVAILGQRADPAATNLLSYYLRDTPAALVAALLLVYQPPLLDILPLYVLFMLASPWLLAFALRAGWWPVLAGSAGLWLLSQFGLAPWMYRALGSLMPLPVPYGETGAFVSFAWQLPWVLGLWLGASRHDPQARPRVFPRALLAAAAGVALAGAVWRHGVGQAPFPGQPGLDLLLFDKWQLSPLRVLNLLALLVLALRFGPALAARMPRLRWLETLGAASLPVFCAHLVLVLLVLGVLGANYDRPWWQDSLLLAGCFGAMHAVARLSLRLDAQAVRRVRAA